MSFLLILYTFAFFGVQYSYTGKCWKSSIKVILNGQLLYTEVD